MPDEERDVDRDDERDEGNSEENGEERETEKDDQEPDQPKRLNKLLIGLLSLTIFFALFIFFKGEEQPQTLQEDLTIQAPSFDSSAPPSINLSEEDLINQAEEDLNQAEEDLNQSPPDSEPDAGEIRVGEESLNDTSGDETGKMIIPIPKDELTFFDPFQDLQDESPTSESEGMALLKAERSRSESKPPVIKPSMAKTPLQAGFFAVQLGAFKEKGNADKLVDRLDKKGFKAYVAGMSDGVFRVRIGKFNNREDANKFSTQIRKSDRLKSFVVSN